MGEAPRAALTTGTNPGIAGVPAEILYVVGELVVAVYGTEKLVAPIQLLGIVPSVIVGSGLMVIVTVLLVFEHGPEVTTLLYWRVPVRAPGE